jgi:hypothetical protein
MTGTILGTIEKPNNVGHGENKKKGEGWLAAAMDRLTPKHCNHNPRRAMNKKFVVHPVMCTLRKDDALLSFAFTDLQSISIIAIS